MGLTNIQRLHNLVGNPMDDVRIKNEFEWSLKLLTLPPQPSRVVVHIAGTNGKGSVALKIANTLRRSGKKIGIFCSPHVSSFRERMQVNGELISEDEVVELLPQVFELCVKHDIPATFFEITTLLAFLFYEKHQVDFVVLETGLGGRLDATNVIARPALAVITSIGLEHTRILGDSIEKIAREKGGIIKKDCPVLVGPNCPRVVLQDCATKVGASSYHVPDLVLGDSLDRQTTDYDEENQRIAEAAVLLLQRSHPKLIEDLTPDEIRKGVLIRPPCRFEEVIGHGKTKVILDVAHNPPAMECLTVKLLKTYPSQSFRFVLGMSSDKDLGQCARSLLSAAGPTSIHLVEAAHPRAAKIPDIIAAEPKFSDCHFCMDDRSITKQVTNSLKLAKENGEILVVCGSVFLMAEARQALGFDEPRDSDYISEVAGAGFRQMQENFGNSTFDEDPSGQP